MADQKPLLHRKTGPGKATHAVSGASGTHTYTDEEKYVNFAVTANYEAQGLRIWLLTMYTQAFIYLPSCEPPLQSLAFFSDYICLT